MHCIYYDKDQCSTCEHLLTPIEEQLKIKTQTLHHLLDFFHVTHWLAPVSGPEEGFRNKAKMVVLGMAHQPTLGVLTPSGELVSLCNCPLYPRDMQQLLNRLELFVQQAGLPPYQIDKAKGELKYILVTRSYKKEEFMIRFVLRTTKLFDRISRNLPKLLQEYPKIKVVSANIQPIHMAILEGEEEHFFNTNLLYTDFSTVKFSNKNMLTKIDIDSKILNRNLLNPKYSKLVANVRIEEQLNHIPLFIQPKSFFQTNPIVAEQLYKAAQEWIDDLISKDNLLTSIWDLFCGVGCFGLHALSAQATANKRLKNPLELIKLTGIEIQADAIACAKRSAQIMGLNNVEFRALNSTDFALQAKDKPDLIIVNPPRRGLGNSLSEYLTELSPKYILYSSCNPYSLEKDLKTIHGYRVEKVQLFDLFPHSDHFEVLTLLVKAP